MWIYLVDLYVSPVCQLNTEIRALFSSKEANYSLRIFTGMVTEKHICGQSPSTTSDSMQSLMILMMHECMFVFQVVARHAEPAPRLCNKDPFTLKSGTYLRQVLPIEPPGI